MNTELRVGVIIKPHGIRGEVKVYPTTDSPRRFDVLKKVKLRSGNRLKEIEIEKARYFKNLVILKFKGIDNINDVEMYKNYDIFIDRKYGVPLKENEYYIADIIGMEVFDDCENRIGVIRDVLETGANDVYIVERDSAKDLLLPAIKDCILKVDIETNRMTVHIMDGLLDL